MIPPADMIRAYLVAVGLGTAVPGTNPAPIFTVTDWPIYVSQRPDGPGVPDNCITVYDTSGMKDGRFQKTGFVYEHPGIQIMVRGTDYLTAYAKMYAISQSLDALARYTVTVASIQYLIKAFSRGPILSLGQDREANRQRMLCSLNGKFAWSLVS